MSEHNESPDWEMAVCARVVGEEAPYTVEITGVFPFGTLKLMDIGPMKSREEADDMMRFLKSEGTIGEHESQDQG